MNGDDLTTWLEEQLVISLQDENAQYTYANELIQEFIEEMKRGLNKDKKSSLGMFPAHLSVKNAQQGVPRRRKVAVIDAGGTNIRIGLVSFDEKGEIVLKEPPREQLMIGKDKEVKTTADDFYNVLVKELLPEKDKFQEIGFCFSFPAEITDDHDGILECFTKEIEISDMVKTKVGAGLKNALRPHGINDVEVVVLNDTVATLLGGVLEANRSGIKASSYVGFILATGTNTAYAEEDLQIINVESGGFKNFKRGTFDKQLDKDSDNSGEYFLEKATSGRYLGDLTLRLLKALVSENLVPFSLAGGEKLKSLSELKTWEISNLCKGEGKDKDKDDTGALDRSCLTNEDVDIMKQVFGAVVERAALLSAVNISAAIVKTGAGKRKEGPVCVSIDGTTYNETWLMKEKVEKYLKKLLGERDLYYRCVPAPAPIVGAAIAGLTTFPDE